MKYNDRKGGVLVDAAIWQLFRLATNGRPGAFSPQLRSLVWELTERDLEMGCLPDISLFVGPNLTSFSTVVNVDHPLHLTAVRLALQTLPQSLESLTLMDTTLSTEKATLQSLELVHYWSNLRQFVTTLPISLVDLDFLSTLPCLADLSISTESQAFPFPDQPHLGTRVSKRGGFAKLTELNMHHISQVEDAAVVLRRLPRTLRILSIFASSKLSPTDCNNLISHITELCSPETLTNLTVVCQTDSEAKPHDIINREDLVKVDITPLLPFQKLQCLNLLITPAIYVTPEQARAIPEAFPDIETLCLRGNIKNKFVLNHRFPKIDHTHFLEIVRGCRKLQSIRLEIDATKVTGQEVPLAEDKKISLQEAGFEQSPIYSGEKFAAFLLAHCPALTMVWQTWYECSDSMYEGRWDVVAQAISGRASSSV